MWLATFLVFIVTVPVFYIINWIRRTQNYFIEQKIPYLKSIPLLGAYGDVVLGKEGIYKHIENLYNNLELKKEKYFGMHIFHKPALFVKDLDIIRQIMVTDFNSFNDRYTSSSPSDPLGFYQLFTVKNPLWRTLRTKISPFFSGAKLKAAFYLIEKLGKELNGYVDKKFKNDINRVQFDPRLGHLNRIK